MSCFCQMQSSLHLPGQQHSAAVCHHGHKICQGFHFANMWNHYSHIYIYIYIYVSNIHMVIRCLREGASTLERKIIFVYVCACVQAVRPCRQSGTFVFILLNAIGSLENQSNWRSTSLGLPRLGSS